MVVAWQLPSSPRISFRYPSIPQAKLTTTIRTSDSQNGNCIWTTRIWSQTISQEDGDDDTVGGGDDAPLFSKTSNSDQQENQKDADELSLEIQSPRSLQLAIQQLGSKASVSRNDMSQEQQQQGELLRVSSMEQEYIIPKEWKNDDDDLSLRDKNFANDKNETLLTATTGTSTTTARRSSSNSSKNNRNSNDRSGTINSGGTDNMDMMQDENDGMYLDPDVYVDYYRYMNPDGSLDLANVAQSDSSNTPFKFGDQSRSAILQSLLTTPDLAPCIEDVFPSSTDPNYNAASNQQRPTSFQRTFHAQQHQQNDMRDFIQALSANSSSTNQPFENSERLHQQVFAEEEGYLNQSKLFQQSLTNRTAWTEASKLRRSANFRRLQQQAIQSLEEQVEEMERLLQQRFQNSSAEATRTRISPSSEQTTDGSNVSPRPKFQQHNLDKTKVRDPRNAPQMKRSEYSASALPRAKYNKPVGKPARPSGYTKSSSSSKQKNQMSHRDPRNAPPFQRFRSSSVSKKRPIMPPRDSKDPPSTQQRRVKGSTRPRRVMKTAIQDQRSPSPKDLTTEYQQASTKAKTSIFYAQQSSVSKKLRPTIADGGTNSSVPAPNPPTIPHFAKQQKQEQSETRATKNDESSDP